VAALKKRLSILASVLGLAVDSLIGLIVLRTLFFWTDPGSTNKIVRTIFYLTAPVFDFARKRWPMNFAGHDLMPVAAVAALLFLRLFLVRPFKLWCKR